MSRLVFIVLVAGCAAVSAQPAERISVISIVDHSPKGSPLSVKGDVTAYDKPAQQLRYSVKGRISVTNTSAKPVILTVVSLVGTNVPGVNDTAFHDYYFSDLFEPRSTEEREWGFGPFVSRTGVQSEEGKKWVDIESSSTAQEKVTASVLFVQFADGSTWGDRDEAKAVLASRREIVKRLFALDSIYRREGEAALIDELSEPTELPVISELQDLRNHSDDIGKVVDRLVRTISLIEEHRRRMKSEPTQR